MSPRFFFSKGSFIHTSLSSRSVLFVPGNKPRAIDKARTLHADIIVFDLEDSVAPDKKDEARDMVFEAIKTGGFDSKLMVRTNGLESKWSSADVAAFSELSDKLHALLMPKVEKWQNVLDAEQIMFLNRYSPLTSLWAMVETPLAIQNLSDIAKTGKRLSALVFGSNDLSSALSLPATDNRNAIMTALQLTVACARAYGLDAIDGVYNSFKDKAGFKAECIEGASLGFDGKSLIHPNQIAGANIAFSPSDEAVAHAHALIAAFDEGKAVGLDVIQFEGVMVEALHVEAAKRIIAKVK